MKKITVLFFKTIAGRDRMIADCEFDTMEEAMEKVEAWESKTPDNYAVYS